MSNNSSREVTTTRKEIAHNDMINRDMPNQHPIEAISGWIEFTEDELQSLFNNSEAISPES